MKSERSLTVLEFALLGLLHAEPRSGYDLKKIFETTPMAHCSSSPGAIYPALKRLEHRGLLASTIDSQGSMRPRRIYTLSRQGLDLLESWAARPVSHEDLVWRVDELMLRFSFMGQLVDREVVCRFLEELADGIDRLVAGLESHYRTMSDSDLPAGMLPTGRLALLNGIRSYREMGRWSRQARKELVHADH
jgi:DNA-binding PadR family transcriptional regulator